MLTIKSSYTFPALIDADGDVILSGFNTVKLENKGKTNVVIDGNYIISPGNYLTLGGRVNGTVEQTLAITFTGVGTNALYLIQETITKV